MAQWSGNGSRPNSQPQEEPNIDLLPWVGAYNLKDAVAGKNDRQQSNKQNSEVASEEFAEKSYVTNAIYKSEETAEFADKQTAEQGSNPENTVQEGESTNDASANPPETELTSPEQDEKIDIALSQAPTADLNVGADASADKDTKSAVDIKIAVQATSFASERTHLEDLVQQSDIVIENIQPSLDAGRFLPKFTVGDKVKVKADIFSYGSHRIRANVRWRYTHTLYWEEATMISDGNDLFSSEITLEAPGKYEIVVQANIDELSNWLETVKAKTEAGIFDKNDVTIGEHLIKRDLIDWLEKETEKHLMSADDDRLPEAKHDLEEIKSINRTLRRASDLPTMLSVIHALDQAKGVLAARPVAYSSAKTLQAAKTALYAQRPLCTFSSWYECFPRSTSSEQTKHGTIKDLINRLDYIAEMGFDILYLPPIHPIGFTNRKGKNNSLKAEPDDVGSPWAIGSPDGGHEAIAKELGSLQDFNELVKAAGKMGMEVALDLAFQCSPDHPWVTEHPNWFSKRPDGTIACAENPPKRYEDVYPINFDTDDKENLWHALYDVVTTWRNRGVRIFRVDNPHTKPFDFWEWLISKVHHDDPGVIFLAEAFTRPKIMHYLAKLGFDQSYTYYTWRDTKEELIDYFNELAHGTGSAYFRPNIWPNTPDILAKSLQRGGRPAFISRLIMAGGMSTNYGIYGPAFELLHSTPVQSGSEEYRHSEKYEVKHYNLAQENSISPVIKALNRARKTHPALQNMDSLKFHKTENSNIICWSKTDAVTGDIVIGIVNIDPLGTQSGFVELDLPALLIHSDASYKVHDLLDDCTYEWKGAKNFVIFDPEVRSAHLFEVILNR
jgi:starch synthase (maltosyl-transferring)